MKSLKRYLESSQHTAGPGAGEQPGPAPPRLRTGTAASRPARAGRARRCWPRAWPEWRSPRLRCGGTAASAACWWRPAAGRFARDAQMTLTGAPARLRPLPRLLLRTEVPVSGSAAGAALLACWQQRPGVAR